MGKNHASQYANFGSLLVKKYNFFQLQAYKINSYFMGKY